MGEMEELNAKVLGEAERMLRKLATIELLLDKGADINALDDNGRTPLHYATISGNLEAADLLIARGADASIRDAHGKTAMYYAMRGRRGA